MEHSHGLEEKAQCFNLLIVTLPAISPAHFSCEAFLESIAQVLDYRQYCRMARVLSGGNEFCRQIAGCLLRLAIFSRTGRVVAREFGGAPALSENRPVSISYGSNSAFCVYSTSTRGKIGLDAESIDACPKEFAARRDFLEKMFNFSGKNPACQNEKSVWTRLWTIYEAFYKLLPDKGLLQRLLLANKQNFTGRRAAAARLGHETYYFHSLPVKGHWLTMASADSRLLDSTEFALEWLSLRHFIPIHRQIKTLKIYP